MKATEERLRILYGDDAALDATALEDGFRVVIRLPLRRTAQPGETVPMEDAE